MTAPPGVVAAALLGSYAAFPMPSAAEVMPPDRPAVAAATAAMQERPEGATVLDVPYFPQSELLCGGAAAAMVLRYWGMTGVRAGDFAHLVSEARGGMRADDLSQRIEELGWEVFPFRGRFDEVRRHLRLGRPVISLIEVAGGRFHYVVLVGEADDRLVLHDPAAAPYRLVDRAELERAWSATGGLSLVVVPPPERARNVRPPARADEGDAMSRVDPACRTRFDRAVRAGAAGHAGEAAELLSSGPCATEPAFLRELAGLRLRAGRADEAAELAAQSVARTPDDVHANRTLATALFVGGRPAAALDAWNRIGEPTTDLVRIAGLERMDHRPVARQLGIAGGDPMTSRALRLAERRLAAIPAVGLSRVSYAPTGGGRADVVAAVVERPGLPDSPLPLAATALRAAIYREAALTASSLLGRGESWSGTWRWWENRPAVSFVLATPSEFGPPATWRLEGSWERETFAPDVDGGSPVPLPAVAERSGASLGFDHWLGTAVRGRLTVGFDRWRETGGHLRGGVRVELRRLDDRLRLSLEADRWASLEGRRGHGTASAIAEASSRDRPEGLVLSARGYLRFAGAGAPGTLWPGAGTGIARPALLRAHALLDDGAITGVAFDRNLAGGNLEVVRWFPAGPLLRIGGAAFLDAARRWGERSPTGRADLGIGLRIGTVGGGPILRLDAATGLSDDAWAVSAGSSTYVTP